MKGSEERETGTERREGKEREREVEEGEKEGEGQRRAFPQNIFFVYVFGFVLGPHRRFSEITHNSVF